MTDKPDHEAARRRAEISLRDYERTPEGSQMRKDVPLARALLEAHAQLKAYADAPVVGYLIERTNAFGFRQKSCELYGPAMTDKDATSVPLIARPGDTK